MSEMCASLFGYWVVVGFGDYLVVFVEPFGCLLIVLPGYWNVGTVGCLYVGSLSWGFVGLLA